MKKKLICLMLLLTIIISNITVSFAAPFSDISGHWAEDAITKWSGYNVINGYGKGMPAESVGMPYVD